EACRLRSSVMSLLPPPPTPPLVPYTTLFRSQVILRQEFLPEGRNVGGIMEEKFPLVGKTAVPIAQNGRADRVGGARECQHVHLRSEEHTSELQSRFDLVCRLLLEKKKSRTEV